MASIWSGHLTFGLISMPVRVHSGARSNSISFNQLHKKDHARLKQQMVCSLDGEVVERDQIVKGFEYRKGEYVIVDPEEIKRMEPKTAKTMEIMEFVKADAVDAVYFDSSYYLMPEEAGRKPYALLTRAMEESGHYAIAQITMHNREYTCFLRPHNGGLILHTMFYADEVKQVEGFGRPEVELKDAEVKVAHQLIEALAADWDAEKYKDTYAENLRAMIAAKVEGGEVATPEEAPKLAPVVDLMAALKQSLTLMEGRKKPVKSTQSEPAAAKAKTIEMPSKRARKKA